MFQDAPKNGGPDYQVPPDAGLIVEAAKNPRVEVLKKTMIYTSMVSSNKIIMQAQSRSLLFGC